MSEKSETSTSHEHEPRVIFDLLDPSNRVTKVSHGEYGREFKTKGPWEATDQEWNLFLKQTGAFKQVEAKAEAKP